MGYAACREFGARGPPWCGRSCLRPALWDRLGAAALVTVVSAPPGSGKTILLRSWISEAALAQRRVGSGGA